MSNQTINVAPVFVHASVRARIAYGALLQEIHARLAEVASQHTRQQLDDFYFVDELSFSYIKNVISFNEATLQAARIQAEFNQLPEWRNVGTEVYMLKLDIDGLASRLMCPTSVRETLAQRQAVEQRVATEAAERAARQARKPVVTYKKQRKVSSAAIAA